MTVKCPKCNADNPDTKQFCGDCGTQLSQDIPEVTRTIETPAQELTRGTVFADRFEIIEQLGIGGMGAVYRAEDKKVKEEIALKLIKPEISSDKKMIDRFRNELKVARKIRHENVSGMYDLGEAEGTHFITMEYISGEDLKSFIKRSKKLTVETAISIAKQVCDGLTAAHNLGVVHRDLKPSNIMIDRQGNARIMDFGIARSRETKGITDRGVMIGTPEYLSPEQAETKDADHRSDIYSLGVILYEMVTGQRPFEGETALSVARKQADEMPKDPKEINPQIPDDLNSVILKCLKKDKEERYQSAGDLKTEIEEIERGIPTTDRTTPKRKPLTSKEITVTFGLKKLLIPALIFVAVVIMGLVIWQLLPKEESVPSEPIIPSVAVLPFQDLSPQKDQEYFCDGLADELINRLTKIKNLRIPARTSVFSLKGKALSIWEIGEKLEVSNVLEGSLRRTEDKIRITVQLVKVEDGYPVWSEKYERDEKDIFSLQDEISLEIVDKLQVELLGDTKEKIVKRVTDNEEAYDSYLRGLWIFNNKFSEQDLKKAVAHFEKAIEMDPNFSLAYVELANVYTAFSFWHFLSPAAVLPKAKWAVQKAMQIDNTLGEAYDLRAFIKFSFEWDFSGAEDDLKRALELNPNYPWSHVDFAQLLIIKGKGEEGFKENLIAINLDPLSPRVRANYALNLCNMQRNNEAIEECQKVLELDPDYPFAYIVLGRCYLQMSLFDEAISAFKKAVSFSGDSTDVLLNLAYGYAVSGRREKALEIIAGLDKLSEHKYISNFQKALVYAGLKDKNKAFECLDLAYNDRDPDLVYLKVTPQIDILHSDPRFEVMMKKLNLE